MSIAELDSLVKISKLKQEAPSKSEFAGLIEAAEIKLKDAQNSQISSDSQFDLAYGAAHRLAVAALRQAGYRSENRITVFQTVVHTLKTASVDLQILLRAHAERNLSEYQGHVDIDQQLLIDLIGCTTRLLADVKKLTPPK